MQSIPVYLEEKTREFADLPALRYSDGRERKEITYREFMDRVNRFARGLAALGVGKGDRVYLLADNSPRWIVADLGILRAGAVCVPRGADTTPEESKYILRHSGATAVVAENPRLLDQLPDSDLPIGTRVVLTGERPTTTSFEQILELAGELPEAPDSSELATIVYTSGTTGTPKGVMLTHENILHNVRCMPGIIGVRTDDRFLSVLPSWHMFERTVEYAVFASGATLSYSGLRTLKDDMRTESPSFLVGVPRLWERLHDAFLGKLEKKGGFARGLAKFLLNRALGWTRCCLIRDRRIEDPRGRVGGSRVLASIGAILCAPLGALGRHMVGKPLRQAIGGNMRGAVSGGGMLPLFLDRFLHAAGIPVLVGYGLTETSPVITVRRFEDNVLGTIGRAVPETEIRITDPAGKPLPLGEPGEVEVRGPQVMLGYYGNEEATSAVMREDGWFRTGDICRLTKKGDLIFTGRQKETIVLAGGENIEPYPIEARILESPLVVQALVVGQDRKTLGALLVPDADRAGQEAAAQDMEVEELLRREVRRLVCSGSGFKPREQVGRVAVIEKEFSVEDGTMTRTMKLKRNVILENYADLIDTLYR